MRFFLDEDLSHQIADIARARGLDILSSHESGRDGLTDEVQLRLAAAEGRCLVTQNQRHFIPLTIRSFENNWPHAGVLVVPSSLPGDRFAAIAEALVRYDQEHPNGIPSYGVDFIRPRRT